MLISVLGDLAREYIEWQKIKEKERTKREEIEARIKEIVECTRAFIEEYASIREKRFEERERILSEFMKIYREAAKNNNYMMIEIVGKQIIDVLCSPVIRREDIEGLLYLLAPLYEKRQEKSLPETEDAIPAEIVL